MLTPLRGSNGTGVGRRGIARSNHAMERRFPDPGDRAPVQRPGLRRQNVARRVLGLNERAGHGAVAEHRPLAALAQTQE